MFTLTTRIPQGLLNSLIILVLNLANVSFWVDVPKNCCLVIFKVDPVQKRSVASDRVLICRIRILRLKYGTICYYGEDTLEETKSNKIKYYYAEHSHYKFFGISKWLRGKDRPSRENFLSSFWKGVYSKRKEFAPCGSKFFPFRVDPISEGFGV